MADHSRSKTAHSRRRGPISLVVYWQDLVAIGSTTELNISLSFHTILANLRLVALVRQRGYRSWGLSLEMVGC